MLCGFRFFDKHDLLVFADRTEKPTGAAAGAAVPVGEEDCEFAGGNCVIVQKYPHDMAAGNAWPVEVGRSRWRQRGDSGQPGGQPLWGEGPLR
ncbi:hypothetical protein [Streptomyces chartreusis]|uniref:hypothetical protein n=1 Tax=Streptomyces chartreusis TaxID=1969 RepID=UPI002E179A87